ncbi:hypothetical protein ILUMI_24619, partial [Ignelater luminosus]
MRRRTKLAPITNLVSFKKDFDSGPSEVGLKKPKCDDGLMESRFSSYYPTVETAQVKKEDCKNVTCSTVNWMVKS